MTPGAVRPSSSSADIARWTKLAKAKSADSIQISTDCITMHSILYIPHFSEQTPWPATPRSPPTTTPRPSRKSWRSSSPPIRSRGWSDAVDHEAHRTFLNWLGCAVGAAHHEAADAALAAVQMLQPAPQATRARAAAKRSTWPAPRWSTASPRTPSTSTTPTSRPSSTRPGPVASARAGAGRAHGRQRPRADRRAGARHRRVLPRRQRHVPRPLRPRLAHHRLHRHAGRRRRLRAPAGAGRAADRDGAGHRRLAAGRHARAVRHHDQAVPPGRRGARRPDVARCWPARLHRQPEGAGGAARHDADRLRPRTTGTRSPTSWASASRSPSTPTSRLPAAS